MPKNKILETTAFAGRSPRRWPALRVWIIPAQWGVPPKWPKRGALVIMIEIQSPLRGSRNSEQAPGQHILLDCIVQYTPSLVLVF